MRQPSWRRASTKLSRCDSGVKMPGVTRTHAPLARPSRGTAFYQDAKSAYRTVQVKYLEGGYPDAKTALDDAAKQISSATGLEIAH